MANGDAVLDYYEGAYGPTIRIATEDRNHLAAIRDLFRGLASGEHSTTLLEKAVPTERLEIGSLELRVGTKLSVEKVSPPRAGGESDKPSFVWSQPETAWERCAGLLEGLLEMEGPGHQYMWDEDAHDMIIEVSFRET